jgi:prepilin-type processing-associated H-X9-DG protein
VVSQANLAWTPATPGTDTYYFRHLGGVNVSFVDGHVKWFMPEKIPATSVVCGTGNVGSPTTAAVTWCID